MTIGTISDLETAKNVKVVNAAAIKVELVNPSGQALEVDSSAGALIVIDQEHHEIHEGDSYLVSYKSPDASPIGDNATLIFVLTTSTERVHVIYDHACGGDSEFELYEGCTVTGGTSMNYRNKNRNFPDGGTETVVRDPTVNSAGVLLENTFSPGGTGPQAGGGIGGTRNEWVLKPNTKYMFRVTNRSGGAQPVSLRVEGYRV